MQKKSRAITLGLARAGALLFSLGVLGYLVVTAQFRAGSAQGPNSDSAPADAVGTQVQASEPAAAEGARALAATPAEASAAPVSNEETFLFGSKSMPLDAATADSSKLFLSTSKSAVIELPQPSAPNTTKPTVEPAFLSSSKWLKLPPVSPPPVQTPKSKPAIE